jgi:hypothetical protein
VNVNKSDDGMDGVDWRLLFQVIVIFAILTGIGACFTNSLPRELSHQTQSLGWMAGIAATIVYNFCMLLYMLNKPPLADDPDRRRRTVITIFLFNLVMVGMIVATLMSWPRFKAEADAVGLITFISPERMTPSFIFIFQMIGLSFFCAATYFAMSKVFGIENALSRSLKWPV